MITPAQCRAARALLDWSREQLATAARIGLRTLVDFERGARDPHHATLDAIERALRKAGVTTDLTEGNGLGVRLIGTYADTRFNGG
ncbi:helix-turn-helix transcriptional regulator [Methylobacterium sp. WL116]|uniref:helix-turn-helix domain-containing protein n=1 Tax=Methylobacterium sp. WL116 TaxID=2603889 RepID=UPI0011C8F6C5|nr:helix-turn-helix transcriptional regulator [Methylobacterium sp. WL116]TXM91180.1 helix-turn-helix transcriptional regulator [Methylobacterium sp. WL116]